MKDTELRRFITVWLIAGISAAVAVVMAFSGVLVDRYAHPDLLAVLFGVPLSKILVIGSVFVCFGIATGFVVIGLRMWADRRTDNR